MAALNARRLDWRFGTQFSITFSSILRRFSFLFHQISNFDAREGWRELLMRGGAGGAPAPPMTGLGGHYALWPPPPTLTPVDRNKTYCFHELVLNLPAPLDIQ